MNDPSPRGWAARLDADIEALGRAADDDDWARALELADQLQRSLQRCSLTPAGDEVAAARRANDALQRLAVRVNDCRESTAAALRELRLGQRAVQAYR